MLCAQHYYMGLCPVSVGLGLRSSPGIGHADYGVIAVNAKSCVVYSQSLSASL